MSAVAAPADRRFRRAHVKPGRRRRWRGLLRTGVLSGVGLLVLAFGVYRGGEVAAQAHVLQIDNVVIRGNERVPSATVLAAVDGLKGDNLIWTDLEDWRGRLLQSPWIRDAALRRVLPSTVEIAVAERIPAMLGRIDSRLFLVDDQGMVIDHHGPRYASFDLPIVDGLDTRVPSPGTRLDESRARLGAHLIAALQGRQDLAKRVSQIDVADAHNARVILDGDPVVLLLGEDGFQQRLDSYLQLAATLRAAVADIDYVDLRFGSRVFVGPSGKGRNAAPVMVAAGSSEERRRAAMSR
jgi:cell division septal protein FtsQ